MAYKQIIPRHLPSDTLQSTVRFSRHANSDEYIEVAVPNNAPRDVIKGLEAAKSAKELVRAFLELGNDASGSRSNAV